MGNKNSGHKNNNYDYVKCYKCFTVLKVTLKKVQYEYETLPVAFYCACGSLLCIPGNWKILGSYPAITDRIINDHLSLNVSLNEHTGMVMCQSFLHKDNKNGIRFGDAHINDFLCYVLNVKNIYTIVLSRIVHLIFHLKQ